LDETTPPSGHILDFPAMNEIQNTAIGNFLASPTRHASIVAPVGIGKTLIALSIWERLGRPNTLIVVPRIVLIQNPWLKEMERIGIPSETVGQYYSELKAVKHPITVTLYQSLAANPQLIKDFDLVIFDEEQFLTQGYADLLGRTTSTRYVLGMTGTLAEAARKNPRLTEALPVVFESSIAQARDKNMLAQAEIIPVYVDLPRDELLEYLRMMTAYNSARRMAFRARGRYGQTAAHIVKQKINQLLSNTAPKMWKTLEIIESDPSAPTLVFSLSIQSIETLRTKLEEKGITAKLITHELSDRAKRQAIVDGFGKDYNVLLSVGTLEVGFNVPNASREIIMANTGSLTRTEQRLGRVLRRDPQNPDKIAKVYVEVANGTIDAATLRRVNEAYNRLKAKGPGSRTRSPPKSRKSPSSKGKQASLS
jgi:DNA excision repair protein ERCC-3